MFLIKYKYLHVLNISLIFVVVFLLGCCNDNEFWMALCIRIPDSKIRCIIICLIIINISLGSCFHLYFNKITSIFEKKCGLQKKDEINFDYCCKRLFFCRNQLIVTITIFFLALKLKDDDNSESQSLKLLLSFC